MRSGLDGSSAGKGAPQKDRPGGLSHISRFSLRFLCIAIFKYFVIFHKFHAALDNCATVACCAADMAVMATRPSSVRW